MTIALWCVLAAALLPFPFALAAKWSSRFDNHNPRTYLAQLQGWRQRAHATQLNAFEAFPAFAAGVIIAHELRGPTDAADLLALAFIALRIGFGLLYIADRASLRSLVWLAAQLCVVGLFVVAAGG